MIRSRSCEDLVFIPGVIERPAPLRGSGTFAARLPRRRSRKLVEPIGIEPMTSSLQS